MKSDRQQLIESLATGDITDILKKSPYKFSFTVFVEDNTDGSTSFNMEVTDHTVTPAVRYNRSGKGNWEDMLTVEEKKYSKLCGRIGRICGFVIC